MDEASKIVSLTKRKPHGEWHMRMVRLLWLLAGRPRALLLCRGDLRLRSSDSAQSSLSHHIHRLHETGEARLEDFQDFSTVVFFLATLGGRFVRKSKRLDKLVEVFLGFLSPSSVG